MNICLEYWCGLATTICVQFVRALVVATTRHLHNGNEIAYEMHQRNHQVLVG